MNRPHRKRTPVFESLEDRRVLSASNLLSELDFADRSQSQRDLRVMTQNVYLGGDVGAAVGALFTGDQDTITEAMGELWSSVEATDFGERAEALVDQIERERPDLIGLQEVFVWSTGPAFDPAPAEEVQYDFRQILMDALEERDLDYQIVADTTNTDAEFPGRTEPGMIEDIRLTDHALILVRSDAPRQLRLSNVQEANFDATLPLPIPDGPLVVKRGWNAVDVKFRGRQVRLINTHLESFHPGVQVAQANELLAGPADTDLPVILLGDFNSSADPQDPRNQTDTYDNLVAAGFEDAWSEVYPSDPGPTCCQDADLLNAESELDSRIDLILYRDGQRVDLRAIEAELLGEEPGDRTESGLWPADHAGVSATLRLHRVRPDQIALPPALVEFLDALKQRRSGDEGDSDERDSDSRSKKAASRNRDAWFSQLGARNSARRSQAIRSFVAAHADDESLESILADLFESDR